MSESEETATIKQLKEGALLLLQSYQFPEAVVALGNILKLDPDDYWCWNNLGAALEKLGSIDDAILAFGEAVAIDSSAMAANYNRGCAYLKINNSALAVESLQAALSGEPANAEIMEKLGRAMIQQNQAVAAVPILERSIAIRPDHVDTLYELANACRYSGQDALAIKYFERTVSRHHNHVNALHQLGEIYLWYGEPEKSIKYTTPAIRYLLAKLPAYVEGSRIASFNLEAASQALADLVDCLESIRVQGFLNGGTLLGCMREGTIIGHDKDVDIGVLPGVDGAPIESAIRAHPGMNVDWIDYWEGEILRIRVIHHNGIGSDIFFYREEEDHYWCGVPRGNYAVMWRDSKFELTTTRFLGREFLIPNNPVRYLEENYDQWQKPDPWHVAALTSPNLVGGFGPIQHATALLFITKSLLSGDLDRARYYCEWVQKHGTNISFVDEIVAGIS